MLGKLSWSAIPWDQPIPLISAAVVGILLVAVIAWTVAKGHLLDLSGPRIDNVDINPTVVALTYPG